MRMRTVKPRGPAKWVALGLVKIPGLMATHEDVSPATSEVDDKHFWLVEHDGLVFAPAGATTSQAAERRRRGPAPAVS